MRVEGAEAPIFWLDLEMKAEASLKRLDQFLRAIWLECCNHLSAFRIDRVAYTVLTDNFLDEFRDDRSMRHTIGEVVRPDDHTFSYEYDFGSTTALTLRVVGIREGAAGRSSLRLLARNDPPVWPCAVCRQPATLVCPFCLSDRKRFSCATHAEEHVCRGEHAWLPVVNSPRMGTCGYTGGVEYPALPGLRRRRGHRMV